MSCHVKFSLPNCGDGLHIMWHLRSLCFTSRCEEFLSAGCFPNDSILSTKVRALRAAYVKASFTTSSCAGGKVLVALYVIYVVDSDCVDGLCRKLHAVLAILAQDDVKKRKVDKFYLCRCFLASPDCRLRKFWKRFYWGKGFIKGRPDFFLQHSKRSQNG